MNNTARTAAALASVLLSLVLFHGVAGLAEGPVRPQQMAKAVSASAVLR